MPAPASGPAIAPELARVGGEPALTWIELPDDPGQGREAGRVRFARLTTGASAAAGPSPAVIASGAPGEGPAPLFANWADRPGVVQGGSGPEGPLYAWWLAKSGESTYAYSVHVARSKDLGATWQPLGLLHDDPTPAEHGFVSMVPEGEGVRAFWLDGRATVDGRPMTLRTVRIGERIDRATEELLDPSVCDCCNTAAAVTVEGPLVVYRDRTGSELRDHKVVRRTAEGWSDPQVLADDGWEIPACPVNGPAAAVAGETLWTAWFTAADREPRVFAARSTDGGRTFSAPTLVAGGEEADVPAPLGRIALATEPTTGDAFVSWLGAAAGADGKNVGVVRVRRLAAPRGGSGRIALGPVVEVARTESTRASGVPRILFDPEPAGDRLVVAWVESEPAGSDDDRSSPRLRLAALPVAAVPGG